MPISRLFLKACFLSACLLFLVACRSHTPRIHVPQGFKGDVDIDFCAHGRSARWLIPVDVTGYGVTRLCFRPGAKYEIEVNGELFEPRDPVEILINDDGMVQSLHFIVR